MPDLTAEISALSIVGNGPDSETMKISSASKPSQDYFATSPVEIGEKIATFLDKGSLIAFPSCSRFCRAISVALLWSKVVLEFPIVESRKLRIECILRNAPTCPNSAVHMAVDIRLLLNQPQVAFTGMTIPTFLGMFPGLKELRLIELTPQSWEIMPPQNPGNSYPSEYSYTKRQQIERLRPEQASLALTPLSMPSLSFLDFDSIYCFEDLSHFMTLDGFENIRILSIYTYISTPCGGIGFLGPATVEAKDLAYTLQHFKALRFLLINMGEPIDSNGGAGILSPEFWDAWAGEVVKFCWAVPTLYSIRGQAGLTGRNFRVTRSEDEIQIKEVVKAAEQKVIWADIKTADPNKKWDYWRSNMCIED
ncbi:hypothetical protein TWF132_005189 [Orbilia oligospora]|nr:hypothetical protein TWF132_005189 [Orbilia oligospora]